MSTTLTVTGKVVTDGAAAGTVFATLVNYLPPAAALVGIIYYLLLISANPQFLKIMAWIGSFRVSVRLPSSWRLKLVEDWRHCLKWLSIQFIALAAAIQSLIIAFPLQQYVPPEWMKAAVVICLLGAALGRIIQQGERPNEPDKPIQS